MVVGRAGAGLWEELQAAMAGRGRRGGGPAAAAVCGDFGTAGWGMWAGRAEATATAARVWMEAGAGAST